MVTGSARFAYAVSVSGESFRRAVIARLHQEGFSVRSAARALNYDHAYLSRVLNGRQEPSEFIVRALDRLLGAEGALVELSGALDEEARERIAHGLQKPRTVDRASVDALAHVLAVQRRADDSLPASVMIAATDAQVASVQEMLKEARGPHVHALADVAAEYVQFAGWLHAENRDDAAAMQRLDEALDMADTVDSGPLVAQALNFQGYVARQRNRPRAVARLFRAAYETPGAHPTQRIGDASQAAQGLADMGLTDDARKLLGEATALADKAAGEQPPQTAYWLSPSFQRLNLGLAYLSLGDAGEAATNIADGLAGLPADQQEAEWTDEYRKALERASAGAC